MATAEEVDIAASSSSVIHEYAFASAEGDRTRAKNAFWLARQRESTRLLVATVAIVLSLMILLLALWLGAWSAVGAEWLFVSGFNPDITMLVSVVVTGSVTFALLRLVGWYFNRSKDSERDESQALVRLFDDGSIEFSVDEGLSQARPEQLVRERSFIFFPIEGGHRFVFIPKRTLSEQQETEIVDWATKHGILT